MTTAPLAGHNAIPQIAVSKACPPGVECFDSLQVVNGPPLDVAPA